MAAQAVAVPPVTWSTRARQSRHVQQCGMMRKRITDNVPECRSVIASISAQTERSSTSSNQLHHDSDSTNKTP
eukprot:705243-Rhodomonas_salina.1